MMRQYREVRSTLPKNTLLLFRLGDFYEMFDEDAREGSRILGITLTQRHGQPMAGIPYHAGDTYIDRLLKAGKKVAICEQTETPKPGKLVNRSLVRILTPGTILDSRQVEAESHHYLMGLCPSGVGWAAAWMDLSSGDFQLGWSERLDELLPVMHSVAPKELLIPESLEADRRSKAQPDMQRVMQVLGDVPVTDIPDYHFESGVGERALKEALGVLSLDGFGLRTGHPAAGSAGALVYYATEMLCSRPEGLHRIREYRSSASVLIDPATQRNLEIFRSSDNRRQGSLLDAMDGTASAAGARMLERFLSEPPLEVTEIRRRQDLVECFFVSQSMADELREQLRKVHDLRRILGRLQNRIRNPRELGGVRATLETLPEIKGILKVFDQSVVMELASRIGDFEDLRELLNRALSDELPSDLGDGGVIRSGYDAELDRLRSLNSGNKEWLTRLEADERERTGIRNLKIKYNGAFGYFIEVTKSNLDSVPPEYIRKQTMVGAERFVTEELRQKEREILHAEEVGIAREEKLFLEICGSVAARSEALSMTADALAEMDVFLGWAQISREWDYCKPVIRSDDSEIDIAQGRHPVIEQALRASAYGLAGAQAFVPNDCRLSSDSEQIALITGPNMAGKSTYIRQVALIVLMAHVGSWVPAASCRVGCVDRIFSRVGASDELARGNSTFMVEMNETANILNNASSRSLIILDEIGRGTSTYDGMSIAWAVIEHLHGEGSEGPRTLFATHYHELTQLSERLPRLKNLCVAVKEWNDEIIFVRQVVDGAADRSYGIHVARLAGLPASVIKRAQVLLDGLEGAGSSPSVIPQHPPVRRSKTDARVPQNQLSLFD